MRRNPTWLLVMMAMTSFGVTGCTTSLSSEPAIANDDDETDTGEPVDPTASPTGDPTTFVPEDVNLPNDCDPWMQDCQDGEKCVPYSSDGGTWNANKCVPINGEGQPGDTCSYDGIASATDSCGAESHCWDVMDVDGQLMGVCTPFCSGSADDPICGPATACLIANEGSINLCVATCDPIAQDCADGLGCFWAGNEFQCIFTTDEIMGGEPCGYINDCAPGHLCATADVLPACTGAACCTAFCDLGDPVCGDPETECSAFFEEGTAPPGYESVGVCVMPGA